MIYGPDSDVQIVFQAAEQLRQYGVVAPYTVVPPLIPLLIVLGTSLTRVSIEQVYVAITLLAWAGGSAAVYGTLRRFNTRVSLAAIAAALFAVVPSRLLSIFDVPDGSRLFFGTLVTVLVWLWSDRSAIGLMRSVMLGATTLALVLTVPWPLDGLDVLVVAELAFVLNFPRIWRVVRGLPQGALVGLWLSFSVLLGGWGLSAYLGSIRVPQPMPPSMMVWINQHSPRARVYGLPSLEILTMTSWTLIDRVIQSSGNENLSVRWLKALGFEYLVSRNRSKFHSRLECVYEEGEWCVYVISGSNPAFAVIVSRYGREHLEPLRGPLDIDGLLAYEAWASRAEAARLSRFEDGHIEVNSDLGPEDVILVRLPIRMGWRASVGPRDASNQGLSKNDVKIEADPMGFMVLDSPRAGLLQITLEYHPVLAERLGYRVVMTRPFLEGPFPRIYPGGIGDARTFALSPFRPGAIVSIFGEHFRPEKTRVFFGSMEADVLYTNSQQINAQLPAEVEDGEVSVTVEADGRLSHARMIEVIK